MMTTDAESVREQVARALYRWLYPGSVNTHDSARTSESDAAEFDRAFATWDAGREGFAPGRICRDAADAALAAVAETPGLAEVLRAHARRGPWECSCGQCHLYDGEHARRDDQYADHLADVVRAWLRGTP